MLRDPMLRDPMLCGPMLRGPMLRGRCHPGRIAPRVVKVVQTRAQKVSLHPRTSAGAARAVDTAAHPALRQAPAERIGASLGLDVLRRRRGLPHPAGVPGQAKAPVRTVTATDRGARFSAATRPRPSRSGP